MTVSTLAKKKKREEEKKEEEEDGSREDDQPVREPTETATEEEGTLPDAEEKKQMVSTRSR